MENKREDKPTANDNEEVAKNFITFDELVERSGIDEDTLLRRLAKILNKRN